MPVPCYVTPPRHRQSWTERAAPPIFEQTWALARVNIFSIDESMLFVFRDLLGKGNKTQVFRCLLNLSINTSRSTTSSAGVGLSLLPPKTSVSRLENTARGLEVQHFPPKSAHNSPIRPRPIGFLLISYVGQCSPEGHDWTGVFCFFL